MLNKIVRGVIGITLIVQSVYAIDSSKELCKHDVLNLEAKNKVETVQHKKAISELGKVLLAGNAADCKLIKDNYKSEGWVLIDARNKSSRAATGVFKGTAKITSDHSKPDKHQFTEKKLTKKLTKFFKKRGESTDLKSKRLMLFCNGLKCYRSTWAACDLKIMGYDSSNLYLILDGYPGLEKCLK